MFAAVAAWLAFEFSALAAPQAGLCARLGVMDLDWRMLTSRVNGLLHTQGASQLWAAWLWAIAFGILVGFVAAIESQGPDLNRSIVDLQSTAWPLRHLGLAWIKAV